MKLWARRWTRHRRMSRSKVCSSGTARPAKQQAQRIQHSSPITHSDSDYKAEITSTRRKLDLLKKEKPGAQPSDAAALKLAADALEEIKQQEVSAVTEEV